MQIFIFLKGVDNFETEHTNANFRLRMQYPLKSLLFMNHREKIIKLQTMESTEIDQNTAHC